MTTTAPTTSARPPRLTFGRILDSEWAKIKTVRSTVWTLLALLLVSVLITWAIAALAASDVAKDVAQGKENDAPDLLTVGVAFGQIAALVLGVMSMTAEYSTGMIRTSLTAVPWRASMLAAKALVLASTLFVVGAVTGFGCYFLADVMLSAKDVGVDIGDPGVIRSLIGTGLYLAVLGLFGMALGVLLRHTAGAITVGIALIFVVGGVVGLIPGKTGDWISKLMPANAGSQVMAVNAADKMFQPWTGFAVFVAETLVLLILGAVLLEKRDA
ncbi:ABC transporter permease subunit [Streptomyces sp. SID3343]|uniref:ABC transporter permease subunit n=1 Tax=Streptomyces sp. SID3343 TaxID=2690260 RepID=UPI00136A97D2|nr:ABC transporter permease subunit [Streptomyces sp. SID3343]MYW04905.1 ABC transporter permease subunit [Streptomyces sp. SID3343]